MTDALQEMRYLPSGRVAHIVRPTDPGGVFLKAHCGREERHSWWLGGGINATRRVATLPMCKRCAKAAGR